MGSLAYALGGAIGGAGQGIAAAAAQNSKAIIEEKLMKMREDYENQRQEAGFGHQEQMIEKEHGYNVQAAQAQMGLKREEMGQAKSLAEAHEKGASERTGQIVQGRKDVQAMKNEGLLKQAEAKNKGGKPWKTVPDQVTRIGPNGPETTTVHLLQDPDSNELFAQVGGKLVLWNQARHEPEYPAESLSREQPSQQEMQMVMQHGNDVIPAAFKGGGQTYRQQFHSVYHFLPTGIAKGTGGGSVMQPPGINMNSENDEQESPEETQEDQEASDTGNSVNGVPYSPTAGHGSQPSDTQPAE
jgi:hypothetical protein